MLLQISERLRQAWWECCKSAPYRSRKSTEVLYRLQSSESDHARGQLPHSLIGSCPTRLIWVQLLLLLWFKIRVLADTDPRARSSQDCFRLQVWTVCVESDALRAAAACLQRVTNFFSNQWSASQVTTETESKEKVAEMRAYFDNLTAGSHAVAGMILLFCSVCFESWSSNSIVNAPYFFERSGSWEMCLPKKVYMFTSQRQILKRIKSTRRLQKTIMSKLFWV